MRPKSSNIYTYFSYLMVSGSVRPRIDLKERNPISSCFPLGTDLILYMSHVGIIFCIDGPAFLKEIKMNNSLPITRECCHYFSNRDCPSLAEGFSPFEHSSSGETYFSKLFFKPLKNFLWLNLFCSKKFDNNALFHANRHFLFTHLSCRA